MLDENDIHAVIIVLNQHTVNYYKDSLYNITASVLGEMQRIVFRLMLSSCVCVCVCLCCLSVCVYAAFVNLRKTV